MNTNKNMIVCFFFEEMENHKTLFGWDCRMSSVRPLKTASKEDNGKPHLKVSNGVILITLLLLFVEVRKWALRAF